MKLNPLPPREELESAFAYDRKSGVLTWKTRPDVDQRLNSRRAGNIAGHVTTRGYLRVKINRQAYAVHRLIWVLVHGSIPDGCEIDHIDGDKLNNRLANLRIATRTQNQTNKKGFGRFMKGVKQLRSGRFQSSIGTNGGYLYLGTFDTEIEAHLAYCEAALKIFGAFACTDSVARPLPVTDEITDEEKVPCRT